jgi:peptidoglycan/LPS O-acetylase OafA/YrhL
MSQLNCFMIFSGSLLHYVELDLKRARILPGALILVGLIAGAYDYSPWFSWLHISLPSFPAPLFNPASSVRGILNDAGAFALVAGVIGTAPVARFLGCRAFAYLGGLSFSLYLVHWPIICSFSFGMMFLLKVKNGVDYLQALGVTLVLTMLVTWAVAHVFKVFVDERATRLSEVFSLWVADGAKGRPFFVKKDPSPPPVA